MDYSGILSAVLSIGGFGLVFGLVLGYAGKIFEVQEDPNVSAIREALPGANCGGCGFPGCDAFAAAAASGQAPANGCPVGGAPVAGKIGALLGVDIGSVVKSTAFVKCAGTREKAKEKYEYSGLSDCRAVVGLAGGGSKGCAFGCVGEGSCVRVCKFGALSLVGGIAVVDREKCTACKACVGACPRALIEIVPYNKIVRVACNSNDDGKAVRSVCSAGCIACKLCEKACEFSAIRVEKQLAGIDYEKCTLCGVCVNKCPTKVIVPGH